jgi:hypothetical protein
MTALPKTLIRVACVAASLCASPTARADAPPLDRYEPGILPVVAADSDVGFKFGAFGQLARFRNDVRPYAWRAQVLAVASVREGATGIESPYREAFLNFDRPCSFVPNLRLLASLGYERTTNLGYYGLGNDMPAVRLWDGLTAGSDAYVQARRTYQYDGSRPQARATLRYGAGSGWSTMGDLTLQWITVRTFAGSLLERDLLAPLPDTPTIRRGDGPSARATIGVVYDTRDHETVTTAGQYHDLSLRCGAGFDGGASYCGANLTARLYQGIWGGRISFAARLVADVLWGQPGLMELASYGGVESGQGPGSGRGIRGVPQGRLAGQTKLIGNGEIRAQLFSFRIRSQRFEVMAAGFADAGRVWTRALAGTPGHDGAFRLHWGAGAGPRLRWGDSLLIRADVAYAPLGADLGSVPAIYIDVQQVL